MVSWPAVYKFANDAELLYLESRDDLERQRDLLAGGIGLGDCLVDSSGAMYTLVVSAGAPVIVESTGTVASLEQVLGMVKAHAAQVGSCCVAKLYAPSVGEAIRIAGSLADDS